MKEKALLMITVFVLGVFSNIIIFSEVVNAQIPQPQLPEVGSETMYGRTVTEQPCDEDADCAGSFSTGDTCYGSGKCVPAKCSYGKCAEDRCAYYEDPDRQEVKCPHPKCGKYGWRCPVGETKFGRKCLMECKKYGKSKEGKECFLDCYNEEINKTIKQISKEAINECGFDNKTCISKVTAEKSMERLPRKVTNYMVAKGKEKAAKKGGGKGKKTALGKLWEWMSDQDWVRLLLRGGLFVCQQFAGDSALWLPCWVGFQYQNVKATLGFAGVDIPGWLWIAKNLPKYCLSGPLQAAICAAALVVIAYIAADIIGGYGISDGYVEPSPTKPVLKVLDHEKKKVELNVYHHRPLKKWWVGDECYVRWNASTKMQHGSLGIGKPISPKGHNYIVCGRSAKIDVQSRRVHWKGEREETETHVYKEYGKHYVNIYCGKVFMGVFGTFHAFGMIRPIVYYRQGVYDKKASPKACEQLYSVYIVNRGIDLTNLTCEGEKCETGRTINVSGDLDCTLNSKWNFSETDAAGLEMCVEGFQGSCRSDIYYFPGSPPDKYKENGSLSATWSRWNLNKGQNTVKAKVELKDNQGNTIEKEKKSCEVFIETTSTTTTSTTSISTTSITTTSSTSTSTSMTSTTSSTTSTSTTIPFGICCGPHCVGYPECRAGEECQCQINEGDCEEGMWVIDNVPGSSAMSKRIEKAMSKAMDVYYPSIPFTPSNPGEIMAKLECSSPHTKTAKDRLTIGERFIECPDQCSVLSECACQVKGCPDPHQFTGEAIEAQDHPFNGDSRSLDTFCPSEANGGCEVSFEAEATGWVAVEGGCSPSGPTGSDYVEIIQPSTTTTTSLTSTSTTFSTTTTSFSTTTTTQPLSIQCEDCEAGSQCSCELVGTCNQGGWIIQGSPLLDQDEPFITPPIPPLTASFKTDEAGTLDVTAKCKNPDKSVHTTLEVKKSLLACPKECVVNTECECSIWGCDEAFIEFTNLVSQPLPQKIKEVKSQCQPCTISFQGKEMGTVKGKVTCKQPFNTDKQTIDIVRSTTSTSTTSTTSSSTSTTRLTTTIEQYPSSEVSVQPEPFEQGDVFTVRVNYEHPGGRSGGVHLHWKNNEAELLSTNVCPTKEWKNEDIRGYSAVECGLKGDPLQSGEYAEWKLRALTSQVTLHWRSWDWKKTVSCNGRNDFHRDPRSGTCSSTCEDFGAPDHRDTIRCDTKTYNAG